ncbi:MAG TPA: hypothetical protein VF342_11810 [Alphaproteobacteria bacterium]
MGLDQVRDFGARKDGLSYLLAPGNPSLEGVMLYDDQVYVDGGKVDEIPAALNGADHPFMDGTWPPDLPA